MAAGLGGGLLLCFCLDAVLFRTGFYPYIVEPQSTSGRVDYTVALELARPRTTPRRALVFGDSRMRFLPAWANWEGRRHGLSFGSLVVEGTSPRGWYYMMRAADPEAAAYTAVVVPLDSYDDIDGRDDLADSIVDLHHVVGLLELADVPGFAWSYRTWPRRWQALRGGLFKGAVYQRDIQDFLSHPAARLEKVAAYQENFSKWVHNYMGEEGSLEGLAVDWSRRRIVFPPHLDPAARGALADVVLREPVPQLGRTAAYRRQWLGKIVERYRGTRTRVVFLRLPRGPVVRPGATAGASSVVRALARANPHVLLLDEHLFDGLERPELYVDALHLNGRGSTMLSRMLAEELVRHAL